MRKSTKKMVYKVKTKFIEIKKATYILGVKLRMTTGIDRRQVKSDG